jgi:hypothetical protein
MRKWAVIRGADLGVDVDEADVLRALLSAAQLTRA